MIIDKLTLHNFGIYGGRHELALTPTNVAKPITLIGALNGGGKTTFLDALLLVLYGKFAKCSNRGNLSYDDYLRRCINRKVSAHDGSAIELEFRHRQSNVEEAVKISRAWRATGKGMREDVTVHRDGQIDPECTERWYEFVEELIPSRIAKLFFFDGEKIEDLASPEQAAALIKTGIEALLGLELVDTLEQDLRVIERRKKTHIVATVDQEKLDALQQQVEELVKRRSEACQEKAVLQTNLDQLEKEKRRLEQLYRDRGGELYEQRAEIMAAHTATARELLGIHGRMREVAAGDAPLLLAQALVSKAHKQCVTDRQNIESVQASGFLEKRDAALLAFVATLSTDHSIRETVAAFLESDRNERLSQSQNVVIGIDPEALEPLLDGQLQETRDGIHDLVARASRLDRDLATLARRLESIPDPEGLVGITEALKANEQQTLIIKHKMAENSERQDQFTTQIERKQALIDKLEDSSLRSRFASETSKRVIAQSEATRSLLATYKSRMTYKHLHLLERLILESYLLLLRKKSLVVDIAIDPTSFEPCLFGSARERIPLDRLSAGERQLLAVAILWGLSKASGRTLPTVIDTPLGRLDGAHRDHIVTSYFPAASHQVILLSTDQEIDEHFYSKLQAYLGRSYCIEYDDVVQSSRVIDGYFWQGAA